tara:strand:+ start:9099 stop:9554 length:456 start_codon:yes stop_codon:yes gene_type:complete
MDIVFSEIVNQTDLNKSFELRKEIFIIEQGCPIDEEFDEFDDLNRIGKDSFHFNVYKEGICVSTARAVIDINSAKIQRVCVLKDYRGAGIGLFIMLKLHKYLLKKNIIKVTLSSQDHAIGFYKKLGYIEIGDPYLEAGIIHKKMYINFNSS